MGFKLSDRDKKLLLLLLIVGIIAGSVKLFTTFSDAVTENEQEYKELKEEYNDLVVKNARKQIMIEDTEMAKTLYQATVDSFNTSLSQEQTLVFLGMVEKNTGVWLKQVGFSEISTVYKFGDITSTNPSSLGQKVYSSDYMGICTSMTLAYECTYDDLKNVLTYLEENGRKATISSITFSYSESTDIVTGTMNMSLYAITGSDREVKDVIINDVAVGTDNVFASDTFITSGIDNSYREKIINDYDLYMIMNQAGSDMSTMAVGMANDPSNEAAVSTDTDGVADVTLRVTGSAGEYKVSYKIGSNVYPAENFNDGATLVCGETLDMLIISKPRVDKNDATLANVTIINESDMPLNIAVINDDKESPRVNIQKTEGNVIFYNE